MATNAELETQLEAMNTELAAMSAELETHSDTRE